MPVIIVEEGINWIGYMHSERCSTKVHPVINASIVRPWKWAFLVANARTHSHELRNRQLSHRRVGNFRQQRAYPTIWTDVALVQSAPNHRPSDRLGDGQIAAEFTDVRPRPSPVENSRAFAQCDQRDGVGRAEQARQCHLGKAPV